MQNGDYRKNPKKYRKSIEKDSIVWYNKSTEKIILKTQEVMKMTLNEKKAEAKAKYIAAKARYMETMDKADWVAFCEAKRECMLLGVRI